MDAPAPSRAADRKNRSARWPSSWRAVPASNVRRRLACATRRPARRAYMAASIRPRPSRSFGRETPPTRADSRRPRIAATNGVRRRPSARSCRGPPRPSRARHRRSTRRTVARRHTSAAPAMLRRTASPRRQRPARRRADIVPTGAKPRSSCRQMACNNLRADRRGAQFRAKKPGDCNGTRPADLGHSRSTKPWITTRVESRGRTARQPTGRPAQTPFSSVIPRSNNSMRVIVEQNLEGVSRRAAQCVAELVRRKPTCVLGLATGSTPLGTYAELIRMHREEGLDFCASSPSTSTSMWESAPRIRTAIATSCSTTSSITSTSIRATRTCPTAGRSTSPPIASNTSA